MFVSANCLLNPVGSEGVIEFALQKGQLLAKNENFQVLFLIGSSTARDEGKNGGEHVLEDGPTHLLCAPKFEVAPFCQPMKAGREWPIFQSKILRTRFLNPTGSVWPARYIAAGSMGLYADVVPVPGFHPGRGQRSPTPGADVDVW
jgi:hypothetical protein